MFINFFLYLIKFLVDYGANIIYLSSTLNFLADITAFIHLTICYLLFYHYYWAAILFHISYMNNKKYIALIQNYHKLSKKIDVIVIILLILANK